MVSPRRWLKLGCHWLPLVFCCFFLISVASSSCQLLTNLEKPSHFPQVLVPVTKCKVSAVLVLFLLLSLRLEKLVIVIFTVTEHTCSSWENFWEMDSITIDLLIFYCVKICIFPITDIEQSGSKRWIWIHCQLPPEPSTIPVMHNAFRKFWLTLMKITKNSRVKGREKELYIWRIFLNSFWTMPIQQNNWLNH